MIKLAGARVILKDLHVSISMENVMAYCANFGPVKKAWVHHKDAGSFAFVEFTHNHSVDVILACRPHAISHHPVTIERASRCTLATLPSCHVLDTLCSIPSAHQTPTFFWQCPSPLPTHLPGLPF